MYLHHIREESQSHYSVLFYLSPLFCLILSPLFCLNLTPLVYLILKVLFYLNLEPLGVLFLFGDNAVFLLDLFGRSFSQLLDRPGVHDFKHADVKSKILTAPIAYLDSYQ